MPSPAHLYLRYPGLSVHLYLRYRRRQDRLAQAVQAKQNEGRDFSPQRTHVCLRHSAGKETQRKRFLSFSVVSVVTFVVKSFLPPPGRRRPIHPAGAAQDRSLDDSEFWIKLYLTMFVKVCIMKLTNSLLCVRKSASHAVLPVTGTSYRGVIFFKSNLLRRLYQFLGYFCVS